MVDTAELSRRASAFEGQAQLATEAGEHSEAERLLGEAAEARRLIAVENATSPGDLRAIATREKAARLEREADKARAEGAAAHIELGRRNALEAERAEASYRGGGHAGTPGGCCGCRSPDGEFAHEEDGEEVTLTGSQESSDFEREAKKTRQRIAGEKGV